TIVSIGVLMTAFGRIARTNRELHAPREELARLAVSEERLRIARDLHDLLGHSLSVVALKSELARKLLDRDPNRATAELGDIQSVSRTALTEVRDAVHGYRRLALAEALKSAETALTAAGSNAISRRSTWRFRRMSTQCSRGRCAREPRTSFDTAARCTARS